MRNRWVISVCVALALGGCQWFDAKKPKADEKIMAERMQSNYRGFDRRVQDFQARSTKHADTISASTKTPMADKSSRIVKSMTNSKQPKSPSSPDVDKATQEQLAELKSRQTELKSRLSEKEKSAPTTPVPTSQPAD